VTNDPSRLPLVTQRRGDPIVETGRQQNLVSRGTKSETKGSGTFDRFLRDNEHAVAFKVNRFGVFHFLKGSTLNRLLALDSPLVNNVFDGRIYRIIKLCGISTESERNELDLYRNYDFRVFCFYLASKEFIAEL
jgi:hypothetical protein